MGIPDVFGQVGTLEELQILYGMTAEDIAQKAEELLKPQQQQ